MAHNYPKIYDDFINNLQGKIDLIKISTNAKFNSLEKNLDNFHVFNSHYIAEIKKFKLNSPYPLVPKALQQDLAFYAKALNEGRKLTQELNKYFELKQKDFIRLVKNKR